MRLTQERFNHLVETAAEKMEITYPVSEVMTHSKVFELAHTRWLVWVVLRRHYGMSEQEIAVVSEHHFRSVFYGIKQWEKRMSVNRDDRLAYTATVDVHMTAAEKMPAPFYVSAAIEIHGIERLAA